MPDQLSKNDYVLYVYKHALQINGMWAWTKSPLLGLDALFERDYDCMYLDVENSLIMIGRQYLF